MATKRGAKKPAKKAAAKKPAKKAAAKKTTKKAAPKAAPKAAAAPKKAAHPAVVHWEVQSRDPEKQMRFFGELFGWKIDANNPMNYGLVEAGIGGQNGNSIGGGIGGSPTGSARVTFYVQVKDINATLTQAQTLGARTLMPRTDIGMVIMAQFEDLEGNLIGLIEG